MNYLKKIKIALLLMLVLTNPVNIKAGYLSGDEALGGFSYMMDCAEKNKMPEGNYMQLYYQAYMMFHYTYIITDEERGILERIVEAEATGGNIAQKMNVTSCILARVESSAWPNSIEKVVFEKQQFTPVWDGRYYTVSITEATKLAVDKVLRWGKTHNCLWFCSDDSYNKRNENGEYISYHRNHHTWEFFDGEHHYFYD